jgi:glycosyltransferase involved in cell wall biosynthesis
MKISMLTTTHPYTDGRIFQKEARSLAKKHAVTIIAPCDIPDRFDEAGITIITVKKSKSLLFHPLTILRIFLVARKVDTDVFHCHEPDSFFIGLLLKLFTGLPVIYDVHEHWPDELPFDMGFQYGTPFQKRLTWVLDYMELYLSIYADGVITVCECLAERFRNKGINSIIVANYSIANRDLPYNPEMSGKTIINVAANMHSFYGVQEGIVAVNRIRHKHPVLSLTLIGNIRVNLEDIIPGDNKADWISTTGFLPYQQMYHEINKGSIGLVLIQPIHYHISIALPNKLFDYMLMGLPVVASDLPEIRRVVEDADCGILVNPTDIDAIAKALDYLLSNPEEARRMGENGRKAVIEKYNWGNMEKVLIDFYETFQK